MTETFGPWVMWRSEDFIHIKPYDPDDLPFIEMPPGGLVLENVGLNNTTMFIKPQGEPMPETSMSEAVERVRRDYKEVNYIATSMADPAAKAECELIIKDLALERNRSRSLGEQLDKATKANDELKGKLMLGDLAPMIMHGGDLANYRRFVGALAEMQSKNPEAMLMLSALATAAGIELP